VDYEGIVIEESLASPDGLLRMQFLATDVQPVEEWHQTPWLKLWTLHTVRVTEAEAADVAEAVRAALDSEHSASWYADFKNDKAHYVIFRDRVFVIDRRDAAAYLEAQQYGIDRGLPPHQADFVALIKD
jgi:hypothetical protein